MPQRPYLFVSYSTREEHVPLFLDALEQAVADTYDIRKTPDLLETSQSQLEQIRRTIHMCSIGIVLLDGLRPNVVFEYGLLIGMQRPTMLFLEKDAAIDIRGLHQVEPLPEVKNVPLHVDLHFSDVKDQFIIRWNKYDPKATRQLIKDQLDKKRAEAETS